MKSPTRRGVTLLGFALAATLAGCGASQKPLSPVSKTLAPQPLAGSTERPGAAISAPEGVRGYFPLELGNRWQYARTFRLQVIETGRPPSPTLEYHARIDGEMSCSETRGGRDYTVEHRVERPSGGSEIHSWIRFRQDRSGLYEADLAIGEPACDAAGPGAEGKHSYAAAAALDGVWDRALRSVSEARRPAFLAARNRLQERLALMEARVPGRGGPSGPAAGELTRLRYPLHPGQSWNIREAPYVYAAEVEGRNVLDLPAGRLPAFRIRYSADFFGPKDFVRVWYGRSGLLRVAAHAEGVATDQNGNPIGVVISDEDQVLVDLSLSHGRFAGR
ncbi:MAG TPA: hypothetical protein VGK89_04880 [Candidatus Eisenbacteria bacterium]|jgi:hypothetical protein